MTRGGGRSGTKLQTRGRWDGQFWAGMQFSTEVLKFAEIFGNQLVPGY